MGDTVQCRAFFDNQVSSGKALLETEELIFRGDFRVKIPLKEIKSAVAKDGMLTVRAPGQKLDLELGPYAEKWAAKLTNPAYAIDDETALKVVDGAVEVISEGHWKLFTP